MTVSGLRVTIGGSGLGWTIPPSRPVQIEIPLTVTAVPAGKTFGVRYDMPIGTGTIQTVVGATAASIPAPVAPGPVVVGTVTPTAPVTPALSPDGTVAFPPATVTTAQGTWSFSSDVNTFGNVLLLNGVAPPAGGRGLKLLVKGGQLYTFNGESSWYQWVVDHWVFQAVAP